MKHLFLSILFILFTYNIHSQGLIVVEETHIFSFDFRYEEMMKPESLPNDIIHKMAMITAPTRENFFGFTLFEKSQIIKLKQNNYQIRLSVDSTNFYNKLNYRGYKLNNLVFPNTLKITLQLEDVNSKQEFLIITNKNFKINQTLLFDTIFKDTTDRAFYTLKNLNINCQFTSHQKVKLDSAIAAINKLKDIEPELIKIKLKLQDLQEVKAGMVQIYNIDLKSIEKELQNLNPNTQLSEDLSLELKTEGSIALYDSLIALSRKTRKRFDHMIAIPEYEYFSEGYHALQEGDKEVAKSYFIKSIIQKQTYPPPYYYLAQMAYENQDWDSCAKTISHILTDLEPDFTIRKNTLLLGSKLYNSITYKANNLINSKQINEAIKILYIANNLCSETNELVCSGEANVLLKKAKSDLFYSWISITDKSIINNKVDLSLNYLSWTEDFYKVNMQYLSKSSELDSLKIRLIHLLVVNASAKYNSGFYQKAIDFTLLADSLCAITHYHECESELQDVKIKSYSGLYNNLLRKSKAELSNKANLEKKAETIKKEHPELIVAQSDSVNLDSANERYNELIYEGQVLLESKVYNFAYQKFNEALELEGIMLVERNNSLKEYLKMAAKPLILNDLKAGDLKAWGMHYRAVNTILKMAREEMLKAGLEHDTDILIAISKLEKLAFQNKCAQASISFTKNLKSASENLRYHDFISANTNWEAAIEVARLNPGCNLDIKYPMAEIKKYQSAIKYQKVLSESKEMISQGNDSLGFYYFLTTINNFSADTLSQFGLNKTNPLQFANQTKSLEIQYFNIKYILETNAYEFLLDGIENLLPYYYDKSKYAIILKEGAHYQGIIDKNSGNSFTPKARAKKLFAGNKHLIKEYVRSYHKG